MNITKENKSTIVAIASVLAILMHLGSIISSWDYYKENLSTEYSIILINSLVLLPAILGLWKFKSQNISNWIFGGFVLYGLLVVLGYLNVFFADDPLAAGLPMVVIVLPFAILFSAYLIFNRLKSTSKT